MLQVKGIFSGNRRSFLIHNLLAFTSLLLGFKTSNLSADDVIDKTWLSALVDAIVPPDEDPGAADAGVHERIAELLEKDTHRRKLYAQGKTITDRAIRENGEVSLQEMTSDARTRLLYELAVLRPQTDDQIMYRFLLQLRYDALRFFYASETGQEMLGYRPPIYGYNS